MKIHLIERANRFERKDKTTQNWDSGHWAISSQRAETLVGGDVYFHKNQKKPSFFGGVITSWSWSDQEEFPDRIILHFTADHEHKEVLAGEGGWGNEKKFLG